MLDNEDVFDVLKVYNKYKVSPDMTFTFSKKTWGIGFNWKGDSSTDSFLWILQTL